MLTRPLRSLFLAMMVLLSLTHTVSAHIHPGICVTKKGTVVVVHYEEKKGRVQICRSTDGGESWSPSVPIPGIKDHAYPGALTALSDGRIVVTWNHFRVGPSARRPFYCLSGDEGKTWSEPRGIATNPDNYLSLARSRDTDSWLRHSLLELSPDEWLIPASNKTVVYNAKTGGVTPWDGGKHGGVPIVRSAKGTLVSGAGKRSTDQGKTWQQVKPFPKMDYGSDLIAFSNGYLVAISNTKKSPARLIVSRDDGATWDMNGAITIYDPSESIPGRPHMAQVDQDTLGVILGSHASPPKGSSATLVAIGESGTHVCFFRVPLTKLQPHGK